MTGPTGILGLLLLIAHSGCSNSDSEASPVFGVEVACTKAPCTALVEQRDFFDQLNEATGGEKFALEACNGSLLNIDSSGAHDWFDLATANLVALEATVASKACVAAGSEFCSPEGCAPSMYVAKDPAECGTIVLTDDAPCDACLAQNCCNIAGYCAKAGPVCAGVLSCMRSGGHQCQGQNVATGNHPINFDGVATYLIEELEVCDMKCDEGCFERFLTKH